MDSVGAELVADALRFFREAINSVFVPPLGTLARLVEFAPLRICGGGREQAVEWVGEWACEGVISRARVYSYVCMHLCMHVRMCLYILVYVYNIL